MFPPDEASVGIADKIARMRYSYKEDPAGTDTWTSYADQVLAGRSWQGDCDDLASTVIDLFVRAHPDADLSKLFRLCVKSPECPAGVEFDHMVAGCMVRTGVLIIFGDTFTYPCTYARSPHRIMRYARVSEGVVWREGQPLN